MTQGVHPLSNIEARLPTPGHFTTAAVAPKNNTSKDTTKQSDASKDPRA